MLTDLSQLADAVFSVCTQIFNLYTGTMLLTGVLALWLVRKVAKLFRHLS